jgi:hypothetical protein
MTQWSAYLLSFCSEAIAAALLAFAVWRNIRLSALAAFAAVLGTALTHPIVWPSALWLYREIGYWPGFIIVEVFAILGEWPVYRWLTRVSWPWSLTLSITANAASISLGLILQQLD